jgi:hypothetical protein
MKTIILIALAFVAFNFSFAQKRVNKEIKTQITDSDTPGKKKIRIEKNINGKVEVTEEEIDANDLKNNKKIIIIKDSLVDGDNNEDVRVIINEKQGDGFTWQEDNDNIDGNVRVYTRKGRNNKSGLSRELEYEMERLHDRMADLPAKIRGSRPFEFDDHVMRIADNTTVRSLDIYTNKPDIETLNVKFYAPQEGDVTITVLNLKGEIIAKTEAKNFVGEYVGQLKLKTPVKGTYVVIVAQGEEGITKKIRIE